MSEPYNDEEFEEVKDWLKNAPPNSNRRWMNGEWVVYERLIATVTMWKTNYEDALNGQIVHDDYAKLQEENAKLNAELDRMKGTYQ